jgi:hypothetical protein
MPARSIFGVDRPREGRPATETLLAAKPAEGSARQSYGHAGHDHGYED